MNEDEVRQRLLDAVPTQPERPERLAERRDRATARRRRRTGSAMLVAVAGVALAGALLSVPAPERHLEIAAAHPTVRTATPAVPATGQVGASLFATPAVPATSP